MEFIVDSNKERENDKLTSKYIVSYNNSNIIKTIQDKIEFIKGNPKLNCIIFGVVENIRNYVKANDIIFKEMKRAIGNTQKIRVIIYIETNNKATLIITAENRIVDYTTMIKICNFLTGTSDELIIDCSKSNTIYNSNNSLSWGVPSWNSQNLFTNCNRINFDISNCKELNKSDKESITTALMGSLYKYKSTGIKILVKENIYQNEKIRVANIGESKKIEWAEKKDFGSESVEACQAGVIFTKLENKDCDYNLCLSSIFPITVCVTEYMGIIKDIVFMASEKIVNEAVLKQFVQLFALYLKELINNKEISIELLNELKLNSIISDETCENNGVFLQCNYKDYNIVKEINNITNLYPEKIALSYQNINVTYKELAEKSNELAKRLIALGIKEGEKIVVSLEQDEKLIILLVAIIKVGALYIPIDPSYPKERILFIIEDSESNYIISNMKKESLDSNYKIISYEELQNIGNVGGIELDENPKENGYVIYTSGTSGKPKGVIVPARNIVALLNATKEEFNLRENDVWTMFHSYSFDFSVWEMWGCLLTGGNLIIVPRDIAKSYYDLHDLLVKKKVTIFNQTPASFYTLQKIDFEKRGSKLSSLRLIIFGGEALDTSKIQSWFQKYPSAKCRIINMYGITETTIHVTYRNVYRRDPKYLSNSVGKALSGWEISIRNENGESCLIGMEGEMWISGVGLANGYLNRNKLNEEKFIIDENNKRWYRSGDLGRFRADGSVDYLGRIDNQVKIRGFRIELDEIKNVLLKIPFVEEAVIVVLNKENISKKQIGAFIQLKEKHTYEEIKKYLEKSLPDYMIPSKIVNVDKIPMTVNGKVDYNSLINNTENVKIKDIIKESNDICLEIWERILGTSISGEDDFFRSGGNSLLAVELVSELKRKVDNTLKLKDLYLNSSPNRMKEYLAKKNGGGVTNV